MNDTETKQINSNSLSIPVAIIIAGGLIALAVIFSGQAGGSEAGPGNGVAADNQVKKTPLGPELYFGIAKDLGISESDFQSCIEREDIAERVDEDANNAVAIGGTGTPFSILITASGRRGTVNGAQPYENVKQAIDFALNDTETGDQNLAIGNLNPVDENDYSRGPEDAPVTIIEYSDLECPFCARFHPTLSRVMEEYDGQLRWIYRHFPLDNIHAEATPAAIAAECAGELRGEEAFWEFIDRVFEVQS